MNDEHSIVDVVPLGASETGNAGRVLGAAFETDPLWVAVISDSERRPEMLVEMFAALARTTLTAGGLIDTSPKLEAAALWLPPGREMGPWAMARAGFALPRFVMRLPKPDRRRMLAVLGELQACSKRLMPEPHWYVAAIGVDPPSQGMGYGRRLMTHGIARANRMAAPIYLETETEGNVGFYESLGFDVVEEFTPEAVDVRLWLMAREAAASVR